MAALPRIIGRYIVPPLVLLIIVIILFDLAFPRYENIPGPVTGSRAAGINGTYTIKKARLINLSPDPGKFILLSSGIRSDPSGGACLIFPAKDITGPIFAQMATISCTTNDQCGVCPPGAVCSKPEDLFPGYCEKSTKSCWAKPPGKDALLCRKGTTTTGEFKIQDPGPTAVGGLGLAGSTRVRVLARLNCSDGKICGPDGQNYVHFWGTARPL